MTTAKASLCLSSCLCWWFLVEWDVSQGWQSQTLRSLNTSSWMPLVPALCHPRRPLHCPASLFSVSWAFHLLLISMCRALNCLGIHISSCIHHTSVRSRYHCTDENAKVREGQQDHSASM